MKNIGYKIAAAILGFIGITVSCFVMYKSPVLGLVLLTFNISNALSLFHSILTLDKY